MKILSTYNIKGGVGKTATAVNLAWLAAQDGYRTLLWDLDPQGAASFYFHERIAARGDLKALLTGKRDLSDAIKHTDYEHLDLVPADFSYRDMDVALSDSKRPTKQFIRLMRPLAQAYDVVIVDSSPTVSLASENIFNASDALLIPVIPTPLSVRTFEQLKEYLQGSRLAGRRLLPFFSMADRRKKLHRDLMVSLPQRHSEFLQAEVPQASLVERMGVYRKPVGAFAPNGPVARAYGALWDEIRHAV